MKFLRKPPSERRTRCQNRPSQWYLNFITLFFLSGDFLFGKLAMSSRQKRRTTYLTLLLTSLFLAVDGGSLKGNDQVGMGANPPDLAITTNSTFSSKVENLDTTTNASDGEVEDYQVAISSSTIGSGIPQCLLPQNLVTDGSFDNGLANFPSTGNWEIRNNPPAVINSGNEPSGTIGNDYPAPGSTFAFNNNDSANDAINVTPTVMIDQTYIDGQLDIWFDVAWQHAGGGASHASTLVLNVNGTPYWQLLTIDGEASNAIGTITTLNGAVASSNSPTTLRSRVGGPGGVTQAEWGVIHVSIPYTSNDTPQIQFVMQGQGFTSDDFAIDRIYAPICIPDRGDAPDTYGTDSIAGNNGSDPVGPSHRIINDLHLGTSPDGEADAVLPLDGTGDGADEDGVSLPTLSEGDTSYSIPASDITVTHNAGASPATLHAWIDFDGSGTFEADEYTSQTVSNGITNGNPDGALSWSGAGVSGITGGTNTYARFRLTTDGSIDENTPGGLASDGEVEDYQIAIAASPTDYSDAPTSGTAPDGASTNNYGEAAHIIANGFYLGAAEPDAESAAQPTPSADGDDNNGNDDEDGVTFPILIQGQTTTISVNATGAGGALQAWIDFDGDGTFEAGEQVATNLQDGGGLDTDGTVGTIAFTVNVPATAIITSDTFARFRWSTVQNLDTTTNASDGEVEDYQVAISSSTIGSGIPQCLLPQNLVTDGSFDNGLANFPSTGAWQIGNNPPAVINPGNEPSGAIGNDYPAPGSTFAFNENDAANDAINVTPTVVIDQTYIDGQLDIWFDVAWNQAGGGGSQASTLVLNVNGTTYWQLVTVDGQASNAIGTITTLNGAVASSGSPTILRSRVGGPGGVTQAEWGVIHVSIPYTSNDTPQIQFVMQGQGLASDDFAIDRIYSPICIPDRGDAPDTYGTDSIAGNNGSDPVGPSHRIINDLHLGTSPDGEADAVLPLDGTGDGADEDGVSLPTLSEGDTSYSIPASDITVTHNAGASPATLHAWIDFDGSGTFEADEYTSQTVSSGITNGNPDGALSWSGAGVSGITGGTNTYARFRLTTDGSIDENTPGGLASDGEVEDYQIAIAASPTDYSDAPTSGTAPDGASTNNYGEAAHIIANGFYLGAAEPDAESAAQPTLNADGDDNNGNDDEDGVTFPILIQGQTTTISVNATGAGGALQAWIDFDGDGTFEAGEQVATNLQDGGGLDTDATAGTIAFTVNVPATAIITSDTFARFRWSTVQNLDTTTNASDGEVEDYQLTISSSTIGSGIPQCLLPQNLVTDGSFDNGLANFPSTGNWGISNNPPAVINPGNEPSGAIGNDYPAQGSTFAFNLNDSANDALNVTPTAVIDQTYIDGQLDIWFDVAWQQAGGGGSQASTLVLNVNGTTYWQLVTVDGQASNAIGTITTLNGAVASSSSPTILRSRVGGPGGVTQAEWGVVHVTIPYTSNDTPQIQFVMQGQGLASDDFAIDRIYSPICIPDRGDAPDTYGTDSIAGNNGSDPVGPSHRIINDLHLGTSPDGEADAVLPLDGTGDGADEDGVSLPTLSEGDTSYSIPASDITVTHNAGASPATLHAWIDFDGSGTFEADEYTSQTVSSGITNGNPDGALSWSGAGVSGITGGTNTYARFRLTTDGSIDENTPGGLASDGEVEDYQIAIAAPSLLITGTIFEDVNYGGGAGRDLISSSGVNRPNVRVELYDSTGAFIAADTTDSNGLYQFTSGIIDGQTYSVRIVNNTVTSSRTLNAGHTTADTVAVQTYRYDPDETTPAITDEVGGVQPALVDSDSNTTSANLSTLTAQSLSTFTVSGTTNGVDFGFNFDTIVNTNDSGQGSLRQFINNSNALDNTGLAQDLPASITAPLDKDGNPVILTDYETSIFMIPDPNNDSRVTAGTGTGQINLSNSPSDGGIGSAFVIDISSVLTHITDQFTAVDGRSQSVNIPTVSNPSDTTVTGSETTGAGTSSSQLSSCTTDTSIFRARASNFTLHSLGMTALDNTCHGLIGTAEVSGTDEPSDSNALSNIIADSITAFGFGESDVVFIRTDDSVISQ